ncbi:MAG: Dolichyl-phosphate-mannose-protein mannosyltransferase [Candidatus Methanofastidiosum methylothiophilum]|uniref:Dolichyl-phosphate-mannose-protein mannosyltransferase n=1 Tax=Candidatus Methanofastidiosum methylothiophilum TaxID=1705564 RepID=A0A150ILK6_9EURY|nr:MAG: Dolichyl-phosphate-mannose-protein mannosyltransferase [Candidatus Methanofastidiosum methylthiophilus]KYC48035.1 MAG: Dolichyl-phosphate-mannose-protein mannosyltransferase [Candidatus Methanofastidiosum methylthiophilus]KYC50725.1 MAG: Dolichyl-phosphate-mannose-protein mannosyltransferase [Candidatus Methanofastidiosum methylthiophilus]
MHITMSRNKYILILIVIAIISFAYYVPHYGLIYDGGLYASLGYSLVSGNGYYFNGYPGDVPPILPIFLALFIGIFGENGIFLVVPLFSIIHAIICFLILEKKVSLELSFLGSLYIFFTPIMFYDSMNVIREIPLLTFVMASYLVFLWKDDSYKKHVLIGILIGLAFLTKSVGFVYTFPILVYYVIKMNKKVAINFLSSVIIVLPWAIWSYSHFQTPFVSHSAYLLPQMGTNVISFFTRTLPIFFLGSFIPILPLSILGIKKTEKIFLLFGFFVFLSAFLWPVQEARYLLAGYFLILYTALTYLKDKKKKIGIAFMVIAVLFQVGATVSVLETSVVSYGLLDEAGRWLRENTETDSKVMTQSFRQIHFFSHRKTYQIPQDPSLFQKTLERNKIEYIVIDSYEKTTPKYAREYFKNVEPLATFKDNYGTVNIYRSPYYNSSKLDK